VFDRQHNRSRFKKFKYEIKKFLQNHKRVSIEIWIFIVTTKKGDGQMFHFKYRSKAGREFEIGLDWSILSLIIDVLVFLGGGG
jgi:hypothetical protein